MLKFLFLASLAVNIGLLLNYLGIKSLRDKAEEEAENLRQELDSRRWPKPEGMVTGELQPRVVYGRGPSAEGLENAMFVRHNPNLNSKFNQ